MKAVACKILHDGSIFVNDGMTHDLITFDHHFNEKGRIKGIKSNQMDLSIFRHTSTTNEECILFFKGDATLIKLNLKSMAVEEINNFFAGNDQDCAPMMVAASNEGANIAGISKIGTSYKICIKEGDEAPKQFDAQVKFPRSRH